MTIDQQSHFAAYYNMARHNLFSTLSYISKASGINEGNSNKESHLWDMQLINTLKQKGNPEEKIRIERLIYKHLPFLKPVVEDLRKKQGKDIKTHKMLADIICNWGKVITFYRDKFSHFCFVDERERDESYINREKNVVNDLNQIFTASCRTIKERFKLSTELEFLTKDRYKTVRLENNKRSTKINHKFRYSLQYENGRINQMGLIFLVCQLIEKEYATMLFDQQGYQGRDIYYDYAPLYCKYIRETFSAYKIVIPRGRMNVERNEITLAMDMLNELGKCPSELFDIISKEEQNKFRIKSESTGEEVLNKRYDDRFASLSLTYIDNCAVFENIRFQLSLGKYRYKFYNKQCVDDSTHVRIIQKELNGFGRINEIDALKEEKWGDLIRKFDDVEVDTADSKPYITDHKAKYLFNSNRIGLFYNSAQNSKLIRGAYIPDINNGARCIEPVCWISKYELPALIFHYILTKNKNNKLTESIIINCVERYKRND